ncbi:hypothetical protein ADL05_27615 [Nocardiopsis sp. NRRL B-16309]|nr:hypothetical protein ADL05_27615 [Nocardiopsis sp. NRRL B-16309]
MPASHFSLIIRLLATWATVGLSTMEESGVELLSRWIITDLLIVSQSVLKKSLPMLDLEEGVLDNRRY